MNAKPLETRSVVTTSAPGSSGGINLADYSRANNLDIKPVVFEDNNVRDDTYQKGGCDAITNDKSGLASSRAKFANSDAHTVGDLVNESLARQIARGAGLAEADFDIMQKNLLLDG